MDFFDPYWAVMMRILLRTLLFICLQLSVISLALATETVPINRIVVFGDSLLDNGNLYQMMKLPISPPYYQGHFSNGPIAPEYLQRDLSRAQNNSIALLDYAIGGALTSEKNPMPKLKNIVLPVNEQIGQYLKKYKRFNDDDLIILDGGGNNFLFSFSKRPPFFHPNFIYGIGKDYRKILETLVEAGATHLIVYTIPDITQTPVFDPETPGIVRHLSRKLFKYNVDKANQDIAKAVTQIRRRYPQTDIKILDLAHFFQMVLDHPDRYPFTNLQDACIPMVGGLALKSGAVKDVVACKTPQSYLFWDLVHPSTLAQEMMASKMLDLLGEQIRLLSTS